MAPCACRGNRHRQRSSRRPNSACPLQPSHWARRIICSGRVNRLRSCWALSSPSLPRRWPFDIKPTTGSQTNVTTPAAESSHLGETGDSMSGRSARVLFVAMALVLGGVGGWALVAPARFYRNFPAMGGRHWLPPLGPYNEHMARDFGGLNLGLPAAALVAAVILTRSAALCAALAWEAYSMPHLAFHAAHTEPYSTSDNVLNLVVLSFAVIAPRVAAGLVWRADPRPVLGEKQHEHGHAAETGDDRDDERSAAGGCELVAFEITADEVVAPGAVGECQ